MVAVLAVGDGEFRDKSKESGQIVVYKSKENMEKAIEDGTAEPLDSKDEKETDKL